MAADNALAAVFQVSFSTVEGFRSTGARTAVHCGSCDMEAPTGARASGVHVVGPGTVGPIVHGLVVVAHPELQEPPAAIRRH